MQLLLTMKRHFTIKLWMHVRSSATIPASLNRRSSIWWNMLRHALNLMEEILSTYKFILWALMHKFNVSGCVLVGHFFLVWVCGTCTRSMSTPFCYTLYTTISCVTHINQSEAVRFSKQINVALIQLIENI
jgi:hypothetical protein